MSDNKDTSSDDKSAFLEKEIKLLKSELALKTREIEVEKALEKVRAKALDMRSSSELSETSKLLFQQIKDLRIDAIRSGVGIFDDENTAIELWVTTVSQDGNVFFVLDYINVHVHPVFENIINARDASMPFAVTKLEGADLLNYYKTMSTYAGISKKRDSADCEYYYSFFFSAGTINVVSNKQMTSEEEDIMLRMANVFGLMYTRFLDLKKTEEQAQLIKEEKTMLEQTLENLKATQSQLIQSEKMASLGELTAGIAHEIENPLNFVNNFSEVNRELLVELKEELVRRNFNEASSIADDVINNEEKISHHGKRADTIVRNMLQHSRSSSGQKEPTDINSLAAEYLNLAYHGMRAKDKSFYAKIEKQFDDRIEKISVVPQEIGRVLLNLINNAFYACTERRILSEAEGSRSAVNENYEPTVTVSTQKKENKIEIKVKDNGNGIPDSIKEKIFQPFFTTKPTGQGTGLGLSLSYDIVKAHGGEIKLDSTEGVGSVFTITLPS